MKKTGLFLCLAIGNLALALTVGCKNRDEGGAPFQPAQNRVSPGQCSSTYDPLIQALGNSAGSTLADVGTGRYSLKKVLVVSSVKSWGQTQSELVTEDIMFSATPGASGGQVLHCVSGATLRIPRDNSWVTVPQTVEVGGNGGRVWQYRYIFHTINNSNPEFRSETQMNINARWLDLRDLGEELYGYSSCSRSEVFQIDARTYDVVWIDDCGSVIVRYRARYEKTASSEVR
jgi:hypothetical protein